MLDWQKVEDILFDGSQDSITNLLCPDCKIPIYFVYTPETNSLQYGCKKCGIVVRAHGCSYIPNCFKYQKTKGIRYER